MTIMEVNERNGVEALEGVHCGSFFFDVAAMAQNEKLLESFCFQIKRLKHGFQLSTAYSFQRNMHNGDHILQIKSHIQHIL